jgi:hypothetical protein
MLNDNDDFTILVDACNVKDDAPALSITISKPTITWLYKMLEHADEFGGTIGTRFPDDLTIKGFEYYEHTPYCCHVFVENRLSNEEPKLEVISVIISNLIFHGYHLVFLIVKQVAPLI